MKPVRYISTRGGSRDVSFEEALLAGMAPDGGLYVPAAWPQLSPADFEALRGKSYVEVAHKVLLPFVAENIESDAFLRMLQESADSFEHTSVAPLSQLGPNDWLLELYHGPTLAFKDVALQLLGRLFDYVLKRSGKRITILGATSGDTGSAAIEAIKGREAIEIVILHPEGRVSEVQRRQMTTALEANVHNLAVDGTFDDCRALPSTTTATAVCGSINRPVVR